MVKIRLRRMGARKKPSYRVVVADSRASRNGKFIEVIGNYNPLTNPPTIVIDRDKALMWLGHGAQPTERVAKLLSSAGITERHKTGEGLEIGNSVDDSPTVNTQIDAKETK